MSDVIITVRGEREIRVAPERATIHLVVRSEGAERTTVVDQVMRLAEPVRASLRALDEASTLAEWSSSRLSVRAERPWNNEGKRLAPVYYASIDVTATFTDASDLSLWATEISVWEGVELGHVTWTLTPETRARLEGDAAAHAVNVAVARAQAYAAALGLEHVAPREIADTGLLARPEAASPPHLMARSVAFAADAAPAMEYQPDDIVVSATVEGRFAAR